MARKNDRRKTVAGRKAGKPRAGGAGVAKRAAPPPPAGAKGKPAAKATTPPPPKGKLRGRGLENEPLGRHPPYPTGGPPRFLVVPAEIDAGGKGPELAAAPGP